MLLPAAQSDDGGKVPERDCDVIVFGGGPAGAAAGLALARKGLSVAVFAKPREAPYIGETVAPNIVRPLARLGVWDAFLDAAHAAVPGTVVVWGDERPFENDFLFNPYGPGWHLDRAAFDAMLIKAAQAAGAEICPAPVRDCVRKPCGGWTALFDDQNGGGALSARWVIDATGRVAWFAKRNGAKRHRVDRLVAFVRFASVSSISETRTLIEACQDGWWYAAVLPRQRVAVAFFTDADLLPRGAHERAQHWDRLLVETTMISGIVPPFPVGSPIHAVAACSERLLPCAGANWLTIGDATQAYDPLSGQGIAKAIDSALRAADVVLADRLQDRATVDDYVNAADQSYQRYLANRLTYYRREQRWPQQVFWRRRSGL
jgi:flavin-dependent dehydrogenase